jgi:hypothetical protein
VAGSPIAEPATESRKDQTIGIVLGASRFPNLLIDSPRLGAAFAKSKADAKRYLSRICGRVLDCFDSTKLPNVLCLEVADFLEQHTLATDLIVYYVGHGGFLGTQEYFLACRATREKQKHATGLRVSDLATSIIGSFRSRRVYLIFDCCFAGSAADSFQCASDDLIAKQSEKLPSGVALLNASSRNEAAVVPEGGERTMFSECLLEVLRRGIPARGDRLTLREVGNAVTDLVMLKYPEIAVRPEVHSPRQRDGDVADVPLFPNPGHVKEPTKIDSTAPGVTPIELARFYNFPRTLAGKGQCIGIVSLGGEDYQETDLERYFSSLGLKPPAVQRVAAQPREKATDQRYNAHLTMQIEISGAIAPDARLVIYHASSNTNDGFLSAVEAATVDERNNPSVLLIAWGAPESDWNKQFRERMERALMGAALRGITVCVASGDHPEVHYPATSPYVFACGGTSLKPSNGQFVGETAWSSTGGGVSRIFPRPKWQNGIPLPAADDGGRARRAVPDLSAHADPINGYRIFADGNWTLVGGTTASAALWAGLIALLNEAAGGSHALVHEDLYRYFGPAGVLRNIPTVEAVGSRAGDKPESGWTPVAGWGSPDGDRLVTSIRLRAMFRAGAKE